MGAVAWGEQTVPSGIAGAPHRDDAGLGRDLRPGLPPRAAAGSRRSSGSATGILGVAILVGPGVAFEGCARPGRDRRPAPLADLLGRAARCSRPIGRGCQRPVRHDRARRCWRARSSSGIAAVATGELAAFDPARLRRESLLALVYLTSSAASSRSPPSPGSSASAPLPLIATYAFVNPVVAVVPRRAHPPRGGDAVQLVAGRRHRRRRGADHPVAEPDARRRRRAGERAPAAPAHARGDVQPTAA